MGKSDHFDRPADGTAHAASNLAKSTEGGAGAAEAKSQQAESHLDDSAARHTVDVAPPNRQPEVGDSALIVTKVPLPGEAAGSPSEDDSEGLSADGLTADVGPNGELLQVPSKSERVTGSQSAPSGLPAFPVKDWDRYEFLSLLGQGGMGAVYKARDRRLKRVVALKFIRGDDDRLTKRFLQEARAQARVDHRGICKVLEVGEVQGKSYIAMQFIDGQSLQQAKPQLSTQEKVRIIRDTALALDAAHELGIIHRDIKPANIMIEKSPAGELQPVIMDFGLARDANDENTGMTESGAIMGTAAFMSPEQARGDVKRLDRRTDVYSLGATLYDLLAGKPPFAASSMADTLLKVIIEEAPPLRDIRQDTPEALDIIVSKCLNKEPEQRYHTAKAFAEDLSRFLSAERIVGKRLGLVQRLRWRAKNNPRTAVAVVVMILSILGFIGQGVNVYVQNVRKEREAKRQAELAQRLGQEITVMEWLLRTARGMPAHDLNREKKIVRERMSALQSEFSAFGPGGRALAHYALGRGHMGLHEYPEALKELQQAIDQGFTQGEAYYALGVVLGKHYEKAMHEARLAGGGEWAKKKLQQIEPQYLRPAIDALTKARAARGGSSEYLEALLAYYKRDFETSIHQADAAIQKSPWLYEAIKLQGDVHLERALQARDSGKNEEAENEFATAVKRFSEAGTVGESDAEVFEGLAEAWVRKIEMMVDQGQSPGNVYESAVKAGERITTIEPQSINGHLKIAFAAEKTMSLVGGGKSSLDRVEKCLAAADAVLSKQPTNPYAREMAALCHLFEAELAQGQGKDPEPVLRKPLDLLIPAVKENPQFLWGLNDLATAYAVLGMHLQSKGSEQAKEIFESALTYASRAMLLDDKYVTPIQNSLFIWARFIPTVTSVEDLHDILSHGDTLYNTCMKINTKHQLCTVNYLILYTLAAERMKINNLDNHSLLQKSIKIHENLVKLGGSFLDADQHASLTYYLDAIDKVKRVTDPRESIERAESAIKRCFLQSEKDTFCRTTAARIEWVKAELESHPAQRLRSLSMARDKAELAAQSPEKSQEAWRVLAESYLKLATAIGVSGKEKDRYLADGLIAIERSLSMNKAHSSSLLTKGDLLLIRSGAGATEEIRKASRQLAKQAFENALKIDPFLRPTIERRLITEQ